MTPAQYLDALIKLPGLGGCEISPDGRWAAWTWYRTGPYADVYAARTDGSAPPVRLTRGADDTVFVSWTMDSRSIVVSQDHEGDERAQLFRVDLSAPLKMIPLTEPHPRFYLRGGDLHPNGRWLVYGANYDFKLEKEIEQTLVYRHDLKTGQRKLLARPQRAGAGVPELNPQGTRVLYTRCDLDPAGQQIWLVDVDGKGDHEILNFGPKVKVEASWFPDGRRVIFLAEHGSYRRLGVLDVESGQSRWLIDDPKRNIEAAFVPFGSKKAVVVEVRLARLRCSLLDPDSGVEISLPDVAGNLMPLAPIGLGRWAGEYYSSTQPAEIVSFPIDDPRPRKMTSISRVWERTALTARDFTAARDFVWHSVDGLAVHGWLYRARKPVGTIVYIHGGPTAHSEDQVNIDIQFFVFQGFNVLDPNYRGSTGYGLDFQEAIKKEGWGGLEQEDIRTGIEALIAAGIASAGKVGVTGTSYGGYSSWWAITHWPPSVVAASAPICGMTDLVVDYETTRPDLRPYSEEMMGGSPGQVPGRYHDRSPVNFVDRIRGRLLIVQGLQDPNVTPKNVSQVTAALDRRGIPYQLLAFKDEGHGIGRPKNVRVLCLRLAEFFKEAFASGSRAGSR